MSRPRSQSNPTRSDTSRRNRSGSRAEQGDAYARYAGVGLQFAITIGLFAWGGHALDAKLESSPAFLITGVLAGFIGGLISMVRRLAPPPRSPVPTDDSSSTDVSSATDDHAAASTETTRTTPAASGESSAPTEDGPPDEPSAHDSTPR